MLMMINDVPDLCVVWEPGSSQADTHDPGETVEMINWFKLIQTTLRSALHYVTCKRKDDDIEKMIFVKIPLLWNIQM